MSLPTGRAEKKNDSKLLPINGHVSSLILDLFPRSIFVMVNTVYQCMVSFANNESGKIIVLGPGRERGRGGRGYFHKSQLLIGVYRPGS